MSEQYPYGSYADWFYTMLYRYGGKEYLERLIDYLKASRDYNDCHPTACDQVYEPDWLTQYSDNTLIMAHWDILCCRWGDTDKNGAYINQGCMNRCIDDLSDIHHRHNLYSMMYNTR